MEPLAERLRPTTLDNYIGQKHLVGPDAVMRRMIESGRIASFILWGPPGTGKTTLANIIAKKLEVPFYTLNAVSAGVKDVREVIESAQKNRFFSQHSPILFIDEIHRFNKSQQDSLLSAVERGIVTLIGTTTDTKAFSRIYTHKLYKLFESDYSRLNEVGVHKRESCLDTHNTHHTLFKTSALLFGRVRSVVGCNHIYCTVFDTLNKSKSVFC
jgi:putative ATPase